MTPDVTAAPTLLAVFPPADGAMNFARDDALREHARTAGAELIRLYTWDHPVVSFGRNERTAGRFDPARLRDAGLEAVRRPTGGRALVHHRELTYAIAGPATADATLRSTYERLAQVIAGALARMGVPARVAPPAPSAPLPEGAPCFATPSQGEIVVNGLKLVASAQWREGGAYLQHGSILIDDDQSLLASGLAVGLSLPSVPPAATLRALLGRAPSPEEFADALTATVAERSGVAPVRVAPESLISDAIARSRVEHYRDPAWTWRR